MAGAWLRARRRVRCRRRGGGETPGLLEGEQGGILLLQIGPGRIAADAHGDIKRLFGALDIVQGEAADGEVDPRLPVVGFTLEDAAREFLVVLDFARLQEIVRRQAELLVRDEVGREQIFGGDGQEPCALTREPVFEQQNRGLDGIALRVDAPGDGIVDGIGRNQGLAGEELLLAYVDGGGDAVSAAWSALDGGI